MPVGQTDRLQSSPAIGGPFVVVHAALTQAVFPAGSAELVILGAPAGLVSPGAAILNVGTVRFMPPGSRQNLGGQATLGMGFSLGIAASLWPWYVYEGQSGAIALWVRRNDAVNDVDVIADCTVWPLLAAAEADAARPVERSRVGRVAVQPYRTPHDAVGLGAEAGRIL